MIMTTMTGNDLPKFHRQRFLLFLLEQAGSISVTDFQQLLFLSHQEINLNYYDFVRYGKNWLSFQASSDIEVLKEKSWLSLENNTLTLIDNSGLGQCIKKEERWQINRWISKYKNMKGDSLMQFIDERYKGDLKNNQQNSELFTIGYEGSSLEEYINKLIKNNVQVLYDVRKNPLSRKFGFSKGILADLLPQFGIEYRHLPQLGIISEKRQELNSESDYIKLFSEYEKYLPEKAIYLAELAKTLETGKSIALTCFEKSPRFCHRHCVSNYLKEHYHVGVVHL